MARVTRHQAAALDILDWLYFNQILVHCIYSESEWHWFWSLLDDVKQAVAQTGATDQNAECLKHAIFCVMEIELHDSISRHAVDLQIPFPDGITQESFKHFEAHQRLSFLATLEVFSKTAGRLSQQIAIEIAERLISKYRDGPIELKYRLAERCLAFEYMAAPVEFFKWMLHLGALESKKYRRVASTVGFNELIALRIGLLCEFQALRTAWRVTYDSQSPSMPLLQNVDQLTRRERDEIFKNIRHFDDLSAQTNRKFGYFVPNRMLEASYMQTFLQTYGQNCFRTRLVSGTQGKWLGMLGATLMRIRRRVLQPDETIYSEEGSGDSNSKKIAAFLLARGFTVQPRTLYEHYRDLIDDIEPKVAAYCKMQNKINAVPCALSRDCFYESSLSFIVR